MIPQVIHPSIEAMASLGVPLIVDGGIFVPRWIQEEIVRGHHPLEARNALAWAFLATVTEQWNARVDA